MQKVKSQIKWTESKILYLKENYYSGNIDEMIFYLGITYEAIKSSAKRFKVKRDSNLKFNNKIEKLLLDTNFNWYWLGFIIADGYLGKNELKLAVSEKDHLHIKLLADFLNVNLHKRKGGKYNNYISKDYFEFAVMDSQNVSILKDRFKITTKKSINSCSLESLNNREKLLCFFGGFVDGDGCITQTKSSKKANMLRIQCHSSWLNNLEYLSKELYKYLGIVFKVYIDKQGYARMVIHKNKELKLLKNELIKLDIPLLNRKWNKI